VSGDPGLASWLQLTLTPGLGGAALRTLLKEFGSPENVLNAKRTALERLGAASVFDSARSEAVRQSVERTLAWAESPGHSVVTLADESYPRALLEIPDPPPLLYCAGRAELLAGPALAVVGSRNATAQGVQNAERFARAFSERGVTIVSGLALGIDAAAHRGGLAGPRSTVAVFGAGIDVIYPPQNRALADEIAERGLLVSEFPLGAASLPHHFPRRNRLISGLAQGCLVVEAAVGSGSLITARAAAEQGREVFAIPGSIHSPLARGCHALIKSGAKLVESAEDVLEELAAFRRGAGAARAEHSPWREAPAPAPLAPGESPLLGQMGFDPVDVDSLCRRVGLPAERVSGELLRLELAGRVTALPGGLFQRLN
jgi:DNA processing protein